MSSASEGVVSDSTDMENGHLKGITNRSTRVSDADKDEEAHSARSRPQSRSDGQSVVSSQHSGSASPILVVHSVVCTRRGLSGENHDSHTRIAHFFDVPRLYTNDTRGSALRGLEPIGELDEYLEANSEISVVIHRTYYCSTYHRRVQNDFEFFASGIDREVVNRLKAWFYKLPADGPDAEVSGEHIEFNAESKYKPIDSIVAADRSRFRDWDGERHLYSPYDYFYHFRHFLREKSGSTRIESVRLLLDYIDQTQGANFTAIDKIFKSGKVDRNNFTKLFGPEELIVTYRNGYPRAYVAEKTLRSDQSLIRLECWTWEYDGSFYKETETIEIPWSDPELTVVVINSLVAWPLKWDTSDLRARLEKRGREFWSCRHKKFVSYNSPTQNIFELQTTNPRYMIDANTYRQMHPTKFERALTTAADMEAQGVDMSNDEPSSELFCVLLPSTMLGYGFHDKKWRSLSVEHVAPVPWNEEAFERLVLKPSKKETIRALVSIHLSTRENVDIVEDKGNGLIILLHGPPGTGKTLTAESVAEVAHKPLYRVTCGDMGTEAETVEKYLDSVLLVGKIWGCVVLLDEADVFLEERQVTDLTRNALVSVFLRVLEYYDGILILTSNRVGHFDEAFKSRVHLAVHYPTLDEDGRFEIWHNFLRMLKDKKIDMNYDQLDRKVNLLSRNKFNGRQIRNLVWTAAQVAKFKKDRLDYSHLEQVIGIANEFEEYLERTHGHTDEENAMVQGNRAPE